MPGLILSLRNAAYSCITIGLYPNIQTDKSPVRRLLPCHRFAAPDSGMRALLVPFTNPTCSHVPAQAI